MTRSRRAPDGSAHAGDGRVSWRSVARSMRRLESRSRTTELAETGLLPPPVPDWLTGQSSCRSMPRLISDLQSVGQFLDDGRAAAQLLLHMGQLPAGVLQEEEPVDPIEEGREVDEERCPHTPPWPARTGATTPIGAAAGTRRRPSGRTQIAHHDERRRRAAHWPA